MYMFEVREAVKIDVVCRHYRHSIIIISQRIFYDNMKLTPNISYLHQFKSNILIGLKYPPSFLTNVCKSTVFLWGNFMGVDGAIKKKIDR